MKKSLRKMFAILLTMMLIVSGMSIAVFAEGESENIELSITNKTGMFKAVSAYITMEKGQKYLVMALSGTGYKNLYKGTFEEAVDNGDTTDNWIKGYENTDSKWEFKIPVNEGETYIPIVAISQSYYEKYLNGENPLLQRAFYPRQVEINESEKTLVTGDYDRVVDVEIVNNVKMFSPTKATVHVKSGPNSNAAYTQDLTLTMKSGSYTKIKDAKGNEKELEEGNVFKDVSLDTSGNTPLGFWSAKNSEYYLRTVTLDLLNRKIIFTDDINDAKTALQEAKTAKEEADTAKEEADRAVADADKAAVTAEESKKAAEKAANNPGQAAVDAADKAQKDAEAAKAAADKAKTATETAKEKAQTAKEAADAAKEAADKAVQAASKVSEELEESATEISQEANVVAQNAEKAANEAATAANNAATKATQAEKAVEDAKKATESAKKAKDKADKEAKGKAKEDAKKLKVAKLKVKAKGKKLNVSWKKTSGADSYQVQYKKVKTKKWKNLKKSVKKVKVNSKKLKKGKYQVRVRTIKTVNGEKVYGKWTTSKKVKIK